MALGLALAGLGALGKLGAGLFQGIKANRIDRNNIRPIQQVQSEYFKNVADAEQMARMGLPQEQYNQSLQNIQRNQSGVLGALSRSANPNAGLQSLLRASNDATMNLDVQNALARNQNRRGLMQQRGILAGQKQNAFDWNQKSKYLAKAAEAQALRGAGAQNLMGAFGDVTQMGMMSAMGDSATKANDGDITTFLPNATTAPENINNPMYSTGNYFRNKQPMRIKALTYNGYRR